MIKLLFGSVIATIAMIITGFVYFAGPVALAGYSTADEAQTAAIQNILATNLPASGTYMVPNPSTQSGTILYGKGPVATVHYNSHGFALDSMDGMVWGMALDFIVCLLLAGALSQLDRRVSDFRSRAIIVVCFSLGTTALITLGDPIWLHQDWTYAIFSFVGDALMLIIAGLILARWFLPVAVEAQKLAPAEEIPAVNSPSL